MRTSFFAGIAQLVERNLAKVEVASSSLVSRSTFLREYLTFSHFCLKHAQHGGVAEWSCSGLQSRVRRFDSDPRLHLLEVYLANFLSVYFLLCYNVQLRGVAQPGSVLGWGPSGRRFESSRPDQINQSVKAY
jgi:hypothetical protein